MIQETLIIAKSQEEGDAAQIAREHMQHLQQCFELLFNLGGKERMP